MMIRDIAVNGGFAYSCLCAWRDLLQRAEGFLPRDLADRAARSVRDIDGRMLEIERMRGLSQQWTKAWKDSVVARFLRPNVPEGGVVVEIGPGGGRWSEVLRKRISLMQ
jgi:hypothetical protein